MATSSDQVHGQEYVDFDEYIDIQLRKTGSTIKTTDVLTAVVGILTLVTLYLLLFVICDHWLVPGGFGPVCPRNHAGDRRRRPPVAGWS